MRRRAARARPPPARLRLPLVDEPASGLSEAELADIGDLSRALAARASVVVVEHHMDLMMSVCDAIVVLDFGKVIASGTPDQVRTDDAVTAAYLGVDGGDQGEGGEGA